MGDQKSQAVIEVPKNGRLVTYTVVGIVVFAVLLTIAGTVWACDRFGRCESRLSVLENNYSHIGKALERIEQRLGNRRDER